MDVVLRGRSGKLEGTSCRGKEQEEMRCEQLEQVVKHELPGKQNQMDFCSMGHRSAYHCSASSVVSTSVSGPPLIPCLMISTRLMKSVSIAMPGCNLSVIVAV